MESSLTMEGTAFDREIAARFERATRSGLASSSLASFSYSPDSSRMDQPPTLADLLPHLGPPDAPRCPSCRACLPFGPRSRICLACSARLVQTSPPSFTSTLAFRRFSEALHLDELVKPAVVGNLCMPYGQSMCSPHLRQETDCGEGEAELCSNIEVDTATKFSFSTLPPPIEAGGQKVLTHAEVPSDQGKPGIEPQKIKSDALSPLPSSADLGSNAPAQPMDPTNVEEEKHAGIVGYSASLEGISLEDFFSNQGKSQAPTLAIDSDTLSDKHPISVETPGINVRKDSLFWDPLSDSIIPDGFDLITNTSKTNTNTVALDNTDGVEDGDDPFSSWEGDFQSAAPAAAEISAAASFHSHGAHLSADTITSNIDDVFGVFPSMGGAEMVGTQGNDIWINGDDLFGLKTENISNADSQRKMDVDNFFGSGWQQSVPHPEVSSSSESQSSSSIMQSAAPVKSSQAEDLLGIHSSKEVESSTINHSLDSVGELASTGNLSMKWQASASESSDKKNKIVGSLLAQLHDLSFLLADKLVMKAEGKTTKPDFPR